MTKTRTNRHWSEMDILFIRMNYGNKMNTIELAEHFNTSVFNIRNLICVNKIRRDNTLPKNWKQWQVDLLEQEYETTPDLQGLAERIGKSINAMRSIAYLYGLARPRGRRKNGKGNG